jgi:hypothetical protein
LPSSLLNCQYAFQKKARKVKQVLEGEGHKEGEYDGCILYACMKIEE